MTRMASIKHQRIVQRNLTRLDGMADVQRVQVVPGCQMCDSLSNLEDTPSLGLWGEAASFWGNCLEVNLVNHED